MSKNKISKRSHRERAARWEESVTTKKKSIA
jgi:hypothetical protein